MGNCECNTCPGERSLPGEELSRKEFTDEISGMIDAMRNKHREDFKNIRDHRLAAGKTFRGALAGGKKEGYGEYYYNSNAYFGMFKDDVPEGEGLLVKGYKDYIKGTFSHGKPHGEIKQKIDDMQFQGHYTDGQKAKGILTTSAYTYEGSFKDNMLDGYGILKFKNGDKYEGEFSKGLYHGDGRYETADHGTYHGEFKNGQYHGKGTFKWRDNYYYQGEYRNGLRHGEGKFVNGATEHKGAWVDGQPQGNFMGPTPLQRQKMANNKIAV